MRLITLFTFTMVVVAFTAAPAASDIGEACIATVIEVSSNGEILIELNEGLEPGEYFTVPSTSVYTSSGRHQELPLVGDTCLVTFLNGDKSQPVIFGFCSSSWSEHEFFSNPEDRKTTLPADGSLRIEGSTGRVSITLPSNLSLSVRGESPGVTLQGGGSFLVKFVDSMILRARHLMCTFSESAFLTFGDTTVETENLGYTGEEVTIEADEVTLKVDKLVIECDDIELGGSGGEPVARKGDKVLIPKGNVIIINGEVTEDVEGEIVEGSGVVKAVVR